MALEVVASKAFVKDWKKTQKTRPGARKNFEKIIQLLIEQKPLPANKSDHPLKGNLKGFRDCHVQGDLVLIYRIDAEEKVVRLERIGTHSQLGF